MSVVKIVAYSRFAEFGVFFKKIRSFSRSFRFLKLFKSLQLFMTRSPYPLKDERIVAGRLEGMLLGFKDHESLYTQTPLSLADFLERIILSTKG
jgi:hypothetical protein